jgi:peptidoglycan hydrolase-like protein with peptidoglycan-binding domain
MKPVLTRILRPVVKGFYRLVIKIRRFIRKQRAPRRGRHTAPVGRDVATTRVSPAVIAPAPVVRPADPAARSKSSGLVPRITAFFCRKGWWKRWPVLAGAAVTVAVAAVLIFALPPATAKPEGAMPSGGAYAALADAVDMPEASSTAAVSATPGGSASAIPTLTPAPSETAVSTPEPVSTTVPVQTELAPGVHDERVVEIQTRLMDLGYMDNDEPTDYYGGGTKYALQLFQRKHALHVDGLYGELTSAALFAENAQPYTIKLGDKGTDVKELQKKLKELKYFSGTATGDFGEKTEAAVKAFQKRNGLTADGNVGEHTRDVLFSDDAKPAKTSSGGGDSSGGGSSGGGSSGGGSSGGGSSGGSSGGGKTGSEATNDPDASKADALIAFAQTLLGKEYTRGGKGPNEFDCSGFVYYCLNNSGAKSIKYMTSGTWAKSSYDRVDKMSDLKRGDIICFKGHVGIYMGDGKMIHASSSADQVVIGNAFGSWGKRNFICGRRVVY